MCASSIDQSELRAMRWSVVNRAQRYCSSSSTDGQIGRPLTFVTAVGSSADDSGPLTRQCDSIRYHGSVVSDLTNPRIDRAIRIVIMFGEVCSRSNIDELLNLDPEDNRLHQIGQQVKVRELTMVLRHPKESIPSALRFRSLRFTTVLFGQSCESKHCIRSPRRAE